MAKSIGSLTNNFFASLAKSSPELAILHSIAKIWPELVPARFANITFPLKLTPVNRSNAADKSPYILSIAARTNAIGSEFYYKKMEIISKLDDHFGKKIIKDIKVVLKPASSSAHSI